MLEGSKTNECVYKELIDSDGLASITILLCISLVLCLSSVPCEQGFSLMAIIKTKARNLLNVLTLDAHMMVASNAPKMENYATSEAYERAVADLIDRAYDHWSQKAKRNINRSHPGRAGRRKKGGDGKTMADLLQQQIDDKRRARGRDGPALDSDDEEEGEDDDDDSDVDETATAEIRTAAGPCIPLSGWTIAAAPAATQEEWSSKCTPGFWKSGRTEKRRLGHVWASGWDFATFKRKNKTAGGTGWWFFYGSVKEEISHELQIPEYGCEKNWVILERESRRARPATPSRARPRAPGRR